MTDGLRVCLTAVLLCRMGRSARVGRPVASRRVRHRSIVLALPMGTASVRFRSRSSSSSSASTSSGLVIPSIVAALLVCAVRTIGRLLRQLRVSGGLPLSSFPEPAERQWEGLVRVLRHPVEQNFRQPRLPPVVAVRRPHCLDQGVERFFLQINKFALGWTLAQLNEHRPAPVC